MTDVAAPVFKKRANKGSNIRKRPATPPPEPSGSESDYTDDDDAGVKIKRRKKEGVTLVNAGPKREQNLTKSTNFEADRSQTIAENEDATKASNWYTDAALAAKDAPSTNLIKTETVIPDATDGKYLGTAKYSTFIQKHPDHEKKVGPVKAPTNVRAITVTDFAPDVCKDYKQTGFCGFGDSCKFLHAREDYKQGWQLDKEWEKAGKKDKADGKKDDTNSDLTAEEKMLLEIPFKCIICKQDYKMPIVTKCGHYFCEKCAMARYMKEKKKTCAACGADTGGSFGVAKKLKSLLEKKQLREEERSAKEAGEELDD